MEVKPLLDKLDLKKEVVLTMLNQLGQTSNMFKLHSTLHLGLTLRFHNKTIEDLIPTN